METIRDFISCGNPHGLNPLGDWEGGAVLGRGCVRLDRLEVHGVLSSRMPQVQGSLAHSPLPLRLRGLVRRYIECFWTDKKSSSLTEDKMGKDYFRIVRHGIAECS